MIWGYHYFWKHPNIHSFPFFQKRQIEGFSYPPQQIHINQSTCTACSMVCWSSWRSCCLSLVLKKNSDVYLNMFKNLINASKNKKKWTIHMFVTNNSWNSFLLILYFLLKNPFVSSLQKSTSTPRLRDLLLRLCIGLSTLVREWLNKIDIGYLQNNGMTVNNGTVSSIWSFTLFTLKMNIWIDND